MSPIAPLSSQPGKTSIRSFGKIRIRLLIFLPFLCLVYMLVTSSARYMLHPVCTAAFSSSQRQKLKKELPWPPHVPLTRSSPLVQMHRSHRFSQPLVVTSYMRFKQGDQYALQLFVYTTGVKMGNYNRNFTAVGCVVGHSIYPADSFLYDVTECTIPVSIPRGASISVALLLDDTLQTALREDVQIGKGFTARLEEGDLQNVTDQFNLYHSLGQYKPEQLMVVRSEEKFVEQLDPYYVNKSIELPRYEMCLTTQIKPSTDILPQWIDYHRRLGVDHVYVFDNDAEEDLSDSYRNRDDVSILYWPWEKSQLLAYSYAATMLRPRCEWIMFMDSDEYIMLGLGDGALSSEKRPLKQYLWQKERMGYDQVIFHWVVMKNSDYEKRPDAPIPEAYIHRAEPQPTPYSLGKAAVKADHEWRCNNPHKQTAIEHASRTFDDKNINITPRRLRDSGMIVHYIHRSFEEYQEKVAAGRASVVNPLSEEHLQNMVARANHTRAAKHYAKKNLNKVEWTHFRDLWRRVTAQLSMDEVGIVQRRDGRRCRMQFRIDGESPWTC